MTAVIKTPQVSLSQTSPEADGGLFNVAGTARRLRDSPLLAIGPGAPGPSLRRGFLISVPVGLCLAVEFGFDAPTKGALATGALFAGCVGLDAPSKPRAAWQAAAAPIVGICAAIGILSSQSAPLAVLAMLVVGILAGYCFAVSLRLAIFGLMAALAVLIGQGLFLSSEDALPALALATAGCATQVLWSLAVWGLRDRAAPQTGESGWITRKVLADLRGNLTLRSPNARHAIRFGAALAAGVALYRLLELKDHGFWIPLTILFVMRPSKGETDLRMELRGIGTLLGLLLATAMAETVGGSAAAVAVLLTISAGFAFGMLAVQYALFTTAITVYVVLLTDFLGEPAIEAVLQRVVGTACGLAICFLAFLLWPNPRTR